MKYFLLLILTFNLLAGTPYYPVGKEGSKTSYRVKSVCESKESQACFNIMGKDLRYHKVDNVEIDNLAKPIMKPGYKTAVCDDELDCHNKIAELQETDEGKCDEGDNYIVVKPTIIPGFKIHCSKIIGYEKVVTAMLVEDPTLKAQFLAEDAAKAQEAAKLSQVAKNVKFGELLKQKISLINSSRQLSDQKIVQFVETFATINALLGAGAIKTAKTMIEGLVPDEDLLREQDKTSIVNQISEYLAASPQ